eukprot:TCONS_00025521-protein
MSIISNVSLYVHDKNLVDGNLKSKSTSDLHKQTAPHTAVSKDEPIQQNHFINAHPKPPTVASNGNTTLQIPTIVTTSSTNPASPAASPLLQRSSRFLAGLSGNGTQFNANQFTFNGRKRSMSHSDFSNFYD